MQVNIDIGVAEEVSVSGEHEYRSLRTEAKWLGNRKVATTVFGAGLAQGAKGQSASIPDVVSAANTALGNSAAAVILMKVKCFKTRAMSR